MKYIYYIVCTNFSLKTYYIHINIVFEVGIGIGIGIGIPILKL